MDTIPQVTPQKQCTHPDCLQWFPATTEFFHVGKAYKDGLNSRCKQCRAKAHKEWEARNKEHYKDYHKTYQQIHKEQTHAYNTRYQQTHPEQTKATYKKYWQSHPEQCRAYHHNRDARKKNNAGTHTAQDIQLQYQRQKGKCYYCKKKVGTKYDVDHVTPLSKGGSNGPENLVIACVSCNRRKSNKIVILF